MDSQCPILCKLVQAVAMSEGPERVTAIMEEALAKNTHWCAPIFGWALRSKQFSSLGGIALVFARSLGDRRLVVDGHSDFMFFFSKGICVYIFNTITEEDLQDDDEYAECLFDFFHWICDIFEVHYVASHITRLLTANVIFGTRFLHSTCSLLETFAKSESRMCTDMLLDHMLWTSLAKRIQSPKSWGSRKSDAKAVTSLLVAMFKNGDPRFEMYCIPFVDAAFNKLRVNMLNGSKGIEDSTIVLLVWLCQSSMLCDLMMPKLVDKFGGCWPKSLLVIALTMLESSPVCMVLELQRMDALKRFRDQVKKYNDALGMPGSVQDRVCHDIILILERIWPSKMKSSVGGEATTTTMSLHSCPITLERCNDPVIASDGHIYERDAIMCHMTSSMRSPLTRESLKPILFPVHS